MLKIYWKIRKRNSRKNQSLRKRKIKFFQELPEPEIIEKDGGVQVTMFKVLQSGQAGGAMTDLIYRQKEILEQIMENNKIIYRVIAAQMKINVIKWILK